MYVFIGGCMMFITDDENCIGCKTCEMVCSAHHDGVINPKKARIGVEGEYEKGFSIHACVRCGVCQDACPEDAIFKTNGYYQIDQDLCDNCLECVEACPQDCIFTHPDHETPVICDFCNECVEACPVDVLEIQGLNNG